MDCTSIGGDGGMGNEPEFAPPVSPAGSPVVLSPPPREDTAVRVLTTGSIFSAAVFNAVSAASPVKAPVLVCQKDEGERV